MSGGQGEDSGSSIGFATVRGRDWPSVRQFNVFVANRLGGLMAVVRRFESTDVRIISLTVVDSADCAIIRMVLSDPERALEIFEQAKLPVTESDLLVVKLPEPPNPLLKICKRSWRPRSASTTPTRCWSARRDRRRWPCTWRTWRRR